MTRAPYAVTPTPAGLDVEEKADAPEGTRVPDPPSDVASTVAARFSFLSNALSPKNCPSTYCITALSSFFATAVPLSRM